MRDSHEDFIDKIIADGFDYVMTQCRWSPYKLAAGHPLVVNLDTAIEELYLFLDKLKVGAKVIKFSEGDSICL